MDKVEEFKARRQRRIDEKKFPYEELLKKLNIKKSDFDKLFEEERVKKNV